MTRTAYIETLAAGYVGEFRSLPDGDAAGLFLRLAHEAFMSEDTTERHAAQLAVLTIEQESVQ